MHFTHTQNDLNLRVDTWHTQPTPSRWRSSCRRQKVFTTPVNPTWQRQHHPHWNWWTTQVCVSKWVSILQFDCDLVDSLNLCVLKNKDITLSTYSYHRNQWWPVNKRYSRSWIHATCMKFEDGNIRLYNIRAALSACVRKQIMNRQLNDSNDCWTTPVSTLGLKMSHIVIELHQKYKNLV